MTADCTTLKFVVSVDAARASAASISAIWVTDTVVPPVTPIAPRTTSAVAAAAGTRAPAESTTTAPVGAVVAPIVAVPVVTPIASTSTDVPPLIEMALAACPMTVASTAPAALTTVKAPAATVAVTSRPPVIEVAPVASAVTSVVAAAVKVVARPSVLRAVRSVHVVVFKPPAPEPMAPLLVTLAVSIPVTVAPAGTVAIAPAEVMLKVSSPAPPTIASSADQVVTRAVLPVATPPASAALNTSSPAPPVNSAPVSTPVVSVKTWARGGGVNDVSLTVTSAVTFWPPERTRLSVSAPSVTASAVV